MATGTPPPSTQDAYWNRTPDNDSAKAASRIGRLKDPKRPRKLTEEQSQRVRQEPRIRELSDVRDRLRAEIVSKYGVVKMAEGEPIHKDYQTLGRTLNSTIRAEERAMLRRIQQDYDATAPVNDIQQQLNGELSDDDDDDDQSESPIVQLKFVERQRIAEASLCDPSTFAAQKGFRRHIDLSVDMIALCKWRERQRPRTRCPLGRPPVQTPNVSSAWSVSISLWRTSIPLTRVNFPSNDIPIGAALINSTRTKEYLACDGVILEGKMHFKNHTARVHNFFL
jgi:Protein of unknown function (DUF3435)